MKTLSTSTFLAKASRSFILLAAISLGSIARAGGGEFDVFYSPPSYSVQGDAPISKWLSANNSGTGSSYLVYAPANLPAGVVTPIAVVLSVNSAPAGVSTATALSYVALSTVTLNFTPTSGPQAFNVTLTMPAGTPPGDYVWKIITTGWPTGTTPDVGTFINAHVNPPLAMIPPVIAITTPVDQSRYALDSSGSVTVPVVAVAQANSASVIRSLSVNLGGAPITNLVITPALNQATVSGAGSITVTSPGTYTLNALTTNDVGSAAASVQFLVGRVPTVVIDKPTQLAWTFLKGSPNPDIPFQFTGTSLSGNITQLTATLDGVPFNFSSVGVNTSTTAVGSTTFLGVAVGTHTVVVTASNAFGTATTTQTFVVSMISPVPTIAISDPSPGEVYSHTTGTPALNIPFYFVTNTSPLFTVDSVRAVLDAVTTLDVSVTTGLGTVSATTIGTMLGVAPGLHTLTATGVSAGIPVTASVTFTVVEVVPITPPLAVISTPAEGSTYAAPSGGSVNVPLVFTGTSTTPGASIASLAYRLDTSTIWTPVAVASRSGQSATSVSIAMPFSTAGSHRVYVSATDAIGTGYDDNGFTITIQATSNVSGVVFFDANSNGSRAGEEPGLSGVTVSLLNSAGSTVASTTTSTTGSYSFANISAGSYFVSSGTVNGMNATTATKVPVTATGGSVSVLDIGYALNFCAIQQMSAGGFTIGYWKNNLEKAIAHSTKGIQVSAALCQTYTTAVGKLCLDPFTGITMASADTYMSSTSSAPRDLLAKQLVASEYNCVSGANIGGDARLTNAFITWGELIYKNSSSYSSTYIIYAQQWFDAYNNSHGGLVAGPNTP